METQLKEFRCKLLAGEMLSDEEAYMLAQLPASLHEDVMQIAAEVTAARTSKVFDSCSIVNARSGRCGEDCKWCAQAARHHTHIEVYPIVARDVCMQLAEYNRSRGIRRFSLVTSGRKVSGNTLSTLCDYYKELASKGIEGLCASMGLLEAEELRRLKDAGVTRYHCNLETAPSHFTTLCTTHTIEDKIRTIEAAREEGLEICSGGIIGMGETMRQRVEFALTLRRIKPVSIPLNILSPIPGTPLESTPKLRDEEILLTIALFRLIHPDAVLRFAGGRNALSPRGQAKALRIGINGAIMGDLLTTVGSQITEDIAMIEKAGYMMR